MIRKLILIAIFLLTSLELNAIAQGFGTPEKAFECYAQTEMQGQWNEQFRCFTPSAQEGYLKVLTLAAFFFVSLNDETSEYYKDAVIMKELLKKHGIEKLHDEERVSDKVSNPQAFYVELREFFKNTNFQKKTIDVKLKDLKIEGDKASGKVVSLADDETKEEDNFNFIRVGDQWFIDGPIGVFGNE